MKVIKEQPGIKKTFVVFMLDNSPSMASIVEPTRSGFNEQLQFVKGMESAEHEVYVSLVKFSGPNDIKTLRVWTKAKDIPALEATEYKANGDSTALYDAMDRVLSLAEEKNEEIDQPGNAALILFMTDGEENSSRKVLSLGGLKERIKNLTDKGNWTFTYMGIGDIDQIANRFGINMGNVTQFKHGTAGAILNTQTLNDGLRMYGSSRAAGDTQVANFYNPTHTVAPITPDVTDTDTTNN